MPGPITQPLAPAQLYRHCEPEIFPFATTAEVTDLDGTVGQERAFAALEFGVGMRGAGYNLFVLANPGSHRHRVVHEFLQTQIAARPVPPDWVYVNNFQEDRKPIAIRLPPGRGSAFRRDMAQLVEELKAAIPAAFEGEQYRNRISEINHEFEERLRAHLESLEHEAEQEELSLVPTPHGFAIAPTRRGQLLSDQDFERLPPAEQQRRRESMARLTEKLRHHLEQLPQWHKERRERIKAFNREVTDSAAGRLIERLRAGYADLPEIGRYLDAVREDVLENASDFQPAGEQEMPLLALARPSLRRYQVNLVIEQNAAASAPVVYESNPSLQNLLGHVEYVSQMGALVTDFTMIRPGALHRANGGYLILDADRLLIEPYAWQALKRMLQAGQIRIESLGQLLSLVSTASLEPQTIPLDVKIVLVGERIIYYLLCAYDPDFGELFKVAADFEDRIERNAENTVLYGRMLATLARRASLRPFGRDAVARIVEHAARTIGDAEKLGTRLRDVEDLLREADYWANKDAAATVAAVHVQRAIDARTRRSDRLRTEIQEEILRDTLLIATGGATVGQVNGLAVVSLGEFAFGHPVRITATVRIGSGEIVDIEREAELGGRIHSKAVMIVSSYLAARYAPTVPLSLRASLVFEQSYGGVEGDSASVAETCALLSSLADVPVRQSLAVTGSVNQRGEVQVIGGVNEKIEGFFDICQARGLDGTQGVLIPSDNVKHLMLRADVVEAAAAGRFHIYAVGTIDEAVALLTGTTAGERGADGQFPEDTLNRRVEARLVAFAKARKDFDPAQTRAADARKKTEDEKPEPAP